MVIPATSRTPDKSQPNQGNVPLCNQEISRLVAKNQRAVGKAMPLISPATESPPMVVSRSPRVRIVVSLEFDPRVHQGNG